MIRGTERMSLIKSKMDELFLHQPEYCFFLTIISRLEAFIKIQSTIVQMTIYRDCFRKLLKNSIYITRLREIFFFDRILVFCFVMLMDVLDKNFHSIPTQ